MKALLFSCLLITATAWGQTEQLWTDVMVQKRVTERFFWLVNGGPRFISGWGFNVSYVSAAVGYRTLKYFSLQGGMAYYFTTAPPGGYMTHEPRPWQGMRFDMKLLPWLSVQNFARLEERILLYETHDDFLLRLRNMAGVTFFVYQNKKNNTAGYLPLMYETFEDANKSWLVNRDRFYLGAGYSFQRNRVEIYYIAQRGRSSVYETLALGDNICRVRWFVDL